MEPPTQEPDRALRPVVRRPVAATGPLATLQRNRGKAPPRIERNKNSITIYDELEDVLEKLNVKTSEWDLLLVGDGSGEEWTRPCGWCCALIDRHTGTRKIFTGALSEGTVSLVEIMPYKHALSWYTGSKGPMRELRKKIGQRDIRVHIVTDNSYVASYGERLAQGTTRIEDVRNNVMDWAGLMAVQTMGVALYFHHILRTTIALNVLADAVAGESRFGVVTCDQIAALQASTYPSTRQWRTVENRGEAATKPEVFSLENLVYLVNPSKPRHA
jgi:hypothetical protein